MVIVHVYDVDKQVIKKNMHVDRQVIRITFKKTFMLTKYGRLYEEL